MTMDNDDKVIESMFDEVVETHVKLVDGKYVVVTDEETIAQMDASAMAEAVKDFAFWAKKFRDSNGGDPRHGRANGWWVNLQWLGGGGGAGRGRVLGAGRPARGAKRS